ncbi:translocation/assembly module TamB domain-containing protein [Legionella yabuuchiae]|uniref:translocation/assembly module TamB domain-containing protein n=1 Tax=Legionella yabuuchiae TaxID=376727 RepID=UPI00105560AD|nr:translocation/assembly module TamB domain-containing protein [Legionella yabuuchiae]
MMRYLKQSIYILLSVFIAFVAVLAFFLATTAGLYTTIKLVDAFIPGHLTIKNPEGRLIDRFSFQELVYEDDSKQIKLVQGQVNLKPLPLIRQALTIKQLHSEKLFIKIKDTSEVIEETAEIDFEFPKLPVEIHIHDLTLDAVEIEQLGTTRIINHINLQAKLNNQLWSINHLGIKHVGFSFDLNAEIQPNPPYHTMATLTISEVKKHKRALQGNIQLSGDWSRYQWKGQFSGPLKGKLQGNLQNGHQIQLNAQWQNAKWALNPNYDLLSKTGSLEVTGTWLDMNIKANTAFDRPITAQLSLRTQVKHQKVTARGVLKMPQGNIISNISFDPSAKTQFFGEVLSKSLSFESEDTPISHLEFTTHFSGNSFASLSLNTSFLAQYQAHLLRGEIQYQKNAFNGKVSLGPNELTFKGKSPYQWDAHALLPQPESLHPALTGLNTIIKADANITGPQNGQIELTVNPGSYRATDQEQLPSISFAGGKITAQLTPKGLSGDGKLTIDRNKHINLNVSMPQYSLVNPYSSNQPIQGAIHLNIDSLQFLNGISPTVEKLHGQLTMKLTASGTLGNPALKGLLNLQNASVYFPNLDVTYNPVNLEIQTENNQWNSTGSIVSQGNTLTVNGQGRFYPTVMGEVTLKGENIPAMNTAEYSINISPNLIIQFEPNAIAIKGSVLVPNAEIKPITFSDTVSLTEDAVFVSQKKETTPLTITTDINLNMGENVQLDVKGLTGNLVGGIRIQKLPGSDPFAVGELRVRDGKYQAYGQNLTIKEGQLIFTGGLLTNPGIRIRAVRFFKNASSFAPSNEMFDFSTGNLETFDLGGKVTVGVEVTGRINNPKVKLFSIPSNLSQADILSLMILGKPASQASQSGGQLLLTAISAMDLDSGTKGAQLINQLKNTLGFDFNLQRSASYDQATNEVNQSTAVVIGKSITKRLYLSYNMGLFQNDGNVLTIKYLLNRYFSIQISAGDTGNGIDFLYNHTKD